MAGLRGPAQHTFPGEPGGPDTVVTPHGLGYAIEFMVAFAGSGPSSPMSAKCTVPRGGHMSLAEEVGTSRGPVNPCWVKNGASFTLPWAGGKNTLQGAKAWLWLQSACPDADTEAAAPRPFCSLIWVQPLV